MKAAQYVAKVAKASWETNLRGAGIGALTAGHGNGRDGGLNLNLSPGAGGGGFESDFNVSPVGSPSRRTGANWNSTQGNWNSASGSGV